MYNLSTYLDLLITHKVIKHVTRTEIKTCYSDRNKVRLGWRSNPLPSIIESILYKQFKKITSGKKIFMKYKTKSAEYKI